MYYSDSIFQLGRRQPRKIAVILNIKIRPAGTKMHSHCGILIALSATTSRLPANAITAYGW
jgi:hypothetical protein